MRSSCLYEEREGALFNPHSLSIYMQLDPLHVSFSRFEIWLLLGYQMFHLQLSSLRSNALKLEILEQNKWYTGTNPHN